MKRIRVAIVALVATLTCGAQPRDYYHSVQGLRQSELKTALHRLIQPAKVLKYGGQGAGYTWEGFTQTDVMPDGTVRDRYSNKVYRFDGVNAVPGMNIEHSFANSWWGHTMNNAYCDLHHLYPSDGEANGRKSNNPIGVVDGTVAYDNGVTRIGRSTSYRADSLITVWEPADEWKGDFARTYFYMATCYEHYADMWQTTEGLLMVERNCYPTLRPWVTDLLRQWNEQDPVDEIERLRNVAVQQIQGNRNPFVDYPQLAEYIWGDSTAYRFYTSEGAAPELFVPQCGQTLGYPIQSVLRGYEGAFVLRGRGATGDISLSIDNDAITLGKTTVTPDELLDGVAVSFACHPEEPGTQTARLTMSGGGIESYAVLSVGFVSGIPVNAATDVTCSVNSKKFTASWMRWNEGETYMLNVWDGSGNSLSGYPLETTDTCAVVSGLKASTRYFYNVTTSDGVTSPTVIVDMPEVTPVFSASAALMSFTATPETPSRMQTLGVTLIEVKKYETEASATAPFEISTDGETWGRSAHLKGAPQTLYVRLGAVAAEGLYEGELVLDAEGVDEIVVALNGEVDARKAFFESMETGSKNSYSEGDVSATASVWHMVNVLMGTDANDRKNDKRAARIRVQKDNPNEMTMLEDFALGCDSLWFWAGPYGKDTGVKISVHYSIDGGTTWLPVKEEEALPNATWQRYGYALNIERPLRLRFVGSGANGKRINIDDIQMSAYGTTADAIHNVGETGDDDVVRVYTTSGILMGTGRRADVLRRLPQGLYLIKE